MADDNDDIFDEFLEDAHARAANLEQTDSSAAKPDARRATVLPHDAGNDEACFADLVGGTGDLFTHAMERMRRDAETTAGGPGETLGLIDGITPPEFRTADERAAFDMLAELASQAVETRFDQAFTGGLAAYANVAATWSAQHLTDIDPRFQRDQCGDCEIVAEALIRQLGAVGSAGAEAIRECYFELPCLQQIELLALSGEDPAARRAVASRIVRALPPLAEQLVNWMEEPDDSKAEHEGLALAALLDRRALAANDPFLSALGTEVLLCSLQTPLIRIVDLSPSRIKAAASVWAAPLAERQVVTTRLTSNANAPLPTEAVTRLKLSSAGIASLPFKEAKLTLAEPARRVAVALARTLQSADRSRSAAPAKNEINAQLEPIVLGIGLLIAGVAPQRTSSDRALVRVAMRLGQQHVTATKEKIEREQQRKIKAIQQRRVNDVKAHRHDLDVLLPQLEAARAALAKLGLDETGQPFRPEPTEIDSLAAQPSRLTVIVCPKIDTKGNSKTKEAVTGHEHMLGAELPLVPVGDLPAIRRQLIDEFPWAIEVVDFILGDLVSRQTVTIRPVLLTGTPGSGKTHFVRRFAYYFGSHLWSVDCGGSDGSVFAGTDRRWHSTEPSHPFLAMSRGRQANPLVLLDELEKAPSRNDYGRLWDALLPFLDPGSNNTVQDRCLQVPIDASHVNYIATANSIEPLPWPLRDRFRQVAFPEPAAEHLPALVPGLLAQLASARGFDPRFVAPLTVEDHDFIADRWRGGSVRRLARLIEAIVNARERDSRRH